MRVVANLSVHPKVGTAVAEREATIELLIKIICEFGKGIKFAMFYLCDVQRRSQGYFPLSRLLLQLKMLAVVLYFLLQPVCLCQCMRSWL